MGTAFAPIRRKIEAARANTDALFGMIRPEALYERPIPERHRLVFYIGHLEAFDWNLLREPLGLESFHPEFDRLFAFGIDPPVGQQPQDQPRDWPRLDEVHHYNRKVRAELDARIEHVPEQLFQVAFEHRLMHAETLGYLMHKLPLDAKAAPGAAGFTRAEAPRRPEMIAIPPGAATLGMARNGRFGWDNEFPEMEVQVPAFAISRYKVTNGGYLAFVGAGGPAPPFWFERSGEWFYRAMFAEIPLPLDWPVYTTQEQATAYARWAGKKLPAEAQFHRAAFAGLQRPRLRLGARPRAAQGPGARQRGSPGAQGRKVRPEP